MMPLLLLALVSAHLVGDFVLQTSRMVEAKQAGTPRAYLAHGAIHLALAYLLVALFVPDLLAGLRFHILAVVVIAAHLLIDYVKERFLASSRLPPWLSFLVDQATHVGVIFVAANLFYWDGGEWLAQRYGEWSRYRGPILWLLVVYLTTVFGGGYFIRILLPRRRIAPERDAVAEAKREEEKRVGMYIGWLERFVVLTAIVAKSPTAVGLILAAKSIVRFKKVEADDEFAEYFLLGTFLSLALALVAGLALRWLLFGQLDLE